jgi:hypothetical protein
MPSYTTLPESMLGMDAVVQKFQSSSLAGLRGLGMRGIYQGSKFPTFSGLGCDCSELDDSGNCLDPDPCTTTVDTGSSIPITSSGSLTMNCPGDPGCPGNTDLTPTEIAQTGAAVASYCSSQGLTYNSSTQLCNVPASSGLTASQIAAITAGATKVGIVAAAGATGATVLANGTVIGSGGASTALASTLTSMIPIFVIGLVAFVFLKGGK